jgi:hypothetical protein
MGFWRRRQGGGHSRQPVYRAPGAFVVALTVTDNSGLENATTTITKIVNVEGGQALAITAPDVTCPGSKFDLAVEAGLTGRVRFDYRWLLAGGESQKGERTTAQFDRPGRYDATVLALDEAAMVRGLASKSITVNNRPVANAGPAQLVCPGAQVVLHGSRSYDSDGQLIEATWDFGDGQTSDTSDYSGSALGRSAAHLCRRAVRHAPRRGGHTRAYPSRRLAEGPHIAAWWTSGSRPR